MTRASTSRIVAVAVVGTALVLTACSSSGSDDPGGGGGVTTSTAASATPAKYDLKAAGCPSTIVLQTDWNPESEHGASYERQRTVYARTGDLSSVVDALVTEFAEDRFCTHGDGGHGRK